MNNYEIYKLWRCLEMSHLHIVDGVLHWGFIVFGFALTFVLIGYVLISTEKEELFNSVAKLGVMSALTLIVMSIPLGPLPFHINLSILTALILGPKLGFISVFLVNLILGVFGHGGVTVVGINTLIMGSEIIIGYGIFSFLLSRRVKWNVGIAVAIVIMILVSSTLMVTVVALGQVPPEIAVHTHDAEAIAKYSQFTYGDFALWVLGIVSIGAIIEVVLGTVVISYFRKIRPDYLLKGGL